MLLHAQDNGRQRFQTHPPCFFYPVVPVNAYVATDIPTAFRYFTAEDFVAVFRLRRGSASFLQLGINYTLCRAVGDN